MNQRVRKAFYFVSGGFMYYILFDCKTLEYEIILEVEGIKLSKGRTRIKHEAIKQLMEFTMGEYVG